MFASLSVVVTAAAAVVAAWQIRAWPDSGWPVAAALLIAQIWAAAAFALTVAAMRVGRRQERYAANGAVSVATIICFRGQTRDLLVTSIARATALGEVVVLDVRPEDPIVDTPDLEMPDVVVTGAEAPDAALADNPGPADPNELCDALGLPLILERTEPDGLAAAFQLIHADAVLVVEAVTAVDPTAARDAARQLDGDTAWVTGRNVVYNDDALSPSASQDVNQTVRRGARRLGVALWEEDATLLRTADVRDTGGLSSRRPLSVTLRRLERYGRRGNSLAIPLAFVTAPTEADDYWGVRFAEQSRETQESRSALGGGRFASRLTALGVLLRSLRGVPAVAWLFAPAAMALTGVTPIDGNILIYTSALLALGLARSVLVSVASGDTANPVQRLIGAVYELPGSLASVPAAFRRGRGVGASRRRVPVPGRLLAAVAVLVTAAMWIGLAELVGVTDFKVGAYQGWGIAGCATVLAVLAAAGLRADSLLRSGRSSFRFSMKLAAFVGEKQFETVDVSASGLLVRGFLAAPPVGSPVHGSLRSADGMHHAFNGRVAHAAVVDGQTECGIELDLSPVGLVDWSNWLFDEAEASGRQVVVPG